MKYFLFLTFCLGFLVILTSLKPDSDKKESFIVVIDAGHGGKDPGTCNQQLEEKSICLAVSEQLRQMQAPKHVQLMFTRIDDHYFDLTTRTDFAKEKNADLFISLHVGASKANATGFEIYYPSKGTHSEQSGVYSAMLAHNLNGAIQNLPFRHVKPAGYHVLSNAPCPAMLIEMGFLSNEKDATHISQKKFQRKLAKVILGTVLEISG